MIRDGWAFPVACFSNMYVHVRGLSVKAPSFLDKLSDECQGTSVIIGTINYVPLARF